MRRPTSDLPVGLLPYLWLRVQRQLAQICQQVFDGRMLIRVPAACTSLVFFDHVTCMPRATCERGFISEFWSRALRYLMQNPQALPSCASSWRVDSRYALILSLSVLLGEYPLQNICLRFILSGHACIFHMHGCILGALSPACDQTM